MKRSAAVVIGTCMIFFAAGPVAAKRRLVPVPAWSAFDGARWGDLVPGQTTRAALERDYSVTETTLSHVLQANTSKRVKEELLLAFDGPGPDARLRWIACFFAGGRGVPTLAEVGQRYGEGAQVTEGYPTQRRADWRLRVAPQAGVASVVEPDGTRERVEALIFGPRDALAELARRVSPRETPVGSPLRPQDHGPLVARFGDVVVTAGLMGMAVDRVALRREWERIATGLVQRHSSLQMGGEGRLDIDVDLEPVRTRRETQVQVTARATLAAEGPYGKLRVSSDSESMDVDGESGFTSIDLAARQLIRRVIGEVATNTRRDLQKQRERALAAARAQARLALLLWLDAPAGTKTSLRPDAVISRQDAFEPEKGG